MIIENRSSFLPHETPSFPSKYRNSETFEKVGNAIRNCRKWNSEADAFRNTRPTDCVSFLHNNDRENINFCPFGLSGIKREKPSVAQGVTADIADLHGTNKFTYETDKEVGITTRKRTSSFQTIDNAEKQCKDNEKNENNENERIESCQQNHPLTRQHGLMSAPLLQCLNECLQDREIAKRARASHDLSFIGSSQINSNSSSSKVANPNLQMHDLSLNCPFVDRCASMLKTNEIDISAATHHTSQQAAAGGDSMMFRQQRLMSTPVNQVSKSHWNHRDPRWRRSKNNISNYRIYAQDPNSSFVDALRAEDEDYYQIWESNAKFWCIILFISEYITSIQKKLASNDMMYIRDVMLNRGSCVCEQIDSAPASRPATTKVDDDNSRMYNRLAKRPILQVVEHYIVHNVVKQRIASNDQSFVQDSSLNPDRFMYKSNVRESSFKDRNTNAAEVEEHFTNPMIREHRLMSIPNRQSYQQNKGIGKMKQIQNLNNMSCLGHVPLSPAPFILQNIFPNLPSEDATNSGMIQSRRQSQSTQQEFKSFFHLLSNFVENVEQKIASNDTPYIRDVMHNSGPCLCAHIFPNSKHNRRIAGGSKRHQNIHSATRQQRLMSMPILEVVEHCIVHNAVKQKRNSINQSFILDSDSFLSTKVKQNPQPNVKINESPPIEDNVAKPRLVKKTVGASTNVPASHVARNKVADNRRKKGTTKTRNHRLI